ncbi:MAG: redox-sensing transcriptional repressor Rex [Selenomonadaceae bacterium]|nr:redox-sensing transcriptional repressor Rex [Selenomonadaceae bacterium]
MKPIISQAIIGRLALYFRLFKSLYEDGVQVISSEDIGKKLDITPVQIRKDLAVFGQFGMKGVGYYTSELVSQIGNILGLNNRWNMAIVGVGHLGGALANYKNFETNGFKLTALFDKDTRIIGSYVHGIQVSDVRNLKSIMTNRNIQIGIITVPAPEAQGVANLLVESGVKGIWNFAPTKINVPSEIPLVNEDLAMDLSTLSYHISRE